MQSKKDNQKLEGQPLDSPKESKSSHSSSKQDLKPSSRKDKTYSYSLNSAEPDRGDRIAQGQSAGHHQGGDSDVTGEQPESKSEHLSTSATDQKFIKVFFKGLRSKTTKETVFEVLSAFGPVRYFRMPFNNSLKKNLGYGFVIYSDNATGRYLLQEVEKVSVDGKEILLLDYLTNSRQRKAQWFQNSSPKVHASELESKASGVVRSDYLFDDNVSGFVDTKQLSNSVDAVRDQVAVSLDTQLALFRHRPTSSRYFIMGRKLDSSFCSHNLMFRVEKRVRPS